MSFYSLNFLAAGITCVCLVVVALVMGSFLSKNKFDVAGKTVLLTGASDGMGKSVAKQLAAKGASIVIVARNVQKLEDALAEIKQHASSPSVQRFHYISADVSQAGDTNRLVAETIAWNHGQAPEIVWCMAGMSKPSLFLDSTPEIMREQMDVNYFSCVDMAHAILGHWLAPANVESGTPKHLIFTSSVLAFYTIAGYSPYSPAKAAIRSLLDTLCQEVLLYTKDVKIHAIFPGSIDTAGLINENKIKPEVTKVLEKDDPTQLPDVVASKSIQGLERGQRLVTLNVLGSAMRACAWGGSPRNNWIIDTIFTWLVSLAWYFAAMDLDGKVVSFGKKHGHPSTYAKTT